MRFLFDGFTLFLTLVITFGIGFIVANAASHPVIGILGIIVGLSFIPYVVSRSNEYANQKIDT